MRKEGKRLSVKEEGSGGELGFDLDLDPDPWKILWIRSRNTVSNTVPLLFLFKKMRPASVFLAKK